MASKDGSGLTGWSLLCGVPTTIVALATAPPLGLLALAATVAAFKVGTDRERATTELAEAERMDRLEQDCAYRGQRIAEWKLELAVQQRQWDEGDLDTPGLVQAVETAWASYPRANYPDWFIQYADALASWHRGGEDLLARQLDESDVAQDETLDALWAQHGDESEAHADREPRLRATDTRERGALQTEALRCSWERGMVEAFRRYDEGETDTYQYEEEILSLLPRCPA